jgi:hypothetical protein
MDKRKVWTRPDNPLHGSDRMSRYTTTGLNPEDSVRS